MLIPAASATTITFGTGGTFGFTTGGTTTVTVNDAAGWIGQTVTVTAGTTTTCNPTCLVTASASGYGVDSGGGDIADIDGAGGRLDTLTITFSQPVTLTSIALGNWDNNDNVRILNGATVLQTYSSNTASVALSSLGTTFQFQATGSNDDFQIQSLTFTTPEPATFGMMGLALLGLGIGARKKMKRG